MKLENQQAVQSYFTDEADFNLFYLPTTRPTYTS